MFPQTSCPLAALPGLLLAKGTVHELRALEGAEAHTGFAILLLTAAARRTPVLWVSVAPDWYPPGMAWAGLDLEFCLFAQGKDDAECLGALEAALRGGMAGVAACKSLSRLSARRLAMAAKQGNSLGLVLRHAPARTAEDSTAFATRWLISPAPGTVDAPRVRAELLYAKGAQPGVFMFELIEAEDGTASPVVAPMRRAK